MASLQELYTTLGNGCAYSSAEQLYRTAKEKGLKGITRKKVEQFTQENETYSTHKPVKIRFPRQTVMSYTLNYCKV